MRDVWCFVCQRSKCIPYRYCTCLYRTVYMSYRMVQTIAYYNLIKFVMFRVYELFVFFFVEDSVYIYVWERVSQGYGCLKWNKIQIMHELCRFCMWDRILTLFLYIKFTTTLLHFRSYRFLHFNLHQTNNYSDNQLRYHERSEKKKIWCQLKSGF